MAHERQTMDWMRLRPARPGRLGRPALLVVAAVAVMLLGACSAEPGTGSSGTGATGSDPATVQINPSSGQESSTPTWSTTAACPSGFRGSAIFRAVLPNGSAFSISPATNLVTMPFKGTLLAPINVIQAYSNTPNGHTMWMIVICFSGDSLTGQPHVDMSMFITFSSDGKSYTTSSSQPAGFVLPTPKV
jgi:hypothetical protein